MRFCFLNRNLLNHKHVHLWTSDKRELKAIRVGFRGQLTASNNFAIKVKSQSMTGTVNPDIQRPAEQERQARAEPKTARRLHSLYSEEKQEEGEEGGGMQREHCSFAINCLCLPASQTHTRTH